MEGQKINSYEDLRSKLKGKNYSYLLLYKAGSEQSECAVQNISAATASLKIEWMYADVKKVRDIHGNYNIDTVPTLIEFEKGEFRNMVKGCHSKDYYTALFNHSTYAANSPGEGKSQKRVTVYSTPSCPWCNTLKTYLRKNGIRFSDIDVSRDSGAAEEMVRKSGQQGVPQTDINGTVVIGFDQKKINELLELKTH